MINKPALQQKLLHDLQTCSFRGWGGGEEFPVTHADYEKALDLVELLPEDIRDPSYVFPEEDGTFQFVWYSKSGNLRIFVDDDQTWAAMVCNSEHYSKFYNFTDEIPEVVLERLKEITNEN